MFTVVKPITHSENGSTRKHAIGKRRVVPENIGHLSKTFPLEPLRKHCKDTSNAPEETKFRLLLYPGWF